MTTPKLIAFDCFGTVFDMRPIAAAEVRAYVQHVTQNDFSPFDFPASWWDLKPHADSVAGIKRLQKAGFVCVAMSNGSRELLSTISLRNGIDWDHIMDLVKHRAYKPHNLDAYRAIEKDTGYKPSQCLMVTANPTFGDLQSAAAIGMPSQVIRHGHPASILELCDLLGA